VKAKLKKRITSRAGFSLAETLIAILILLMVSAIVAGAIPAASNVYAKTVDAANAQVLLSTVVTVLRDELSTASITKTESAAIEYVGNDGYRKIVGGTTDPKDIRLYVGTLIPATGEPNYSGYRSLISSEAKTKNLVVSFGSIEYTGGMVIFHNLQVKRSGATESDPPLASRDSLRIRTIK